MTRPLVGSELELAAHSIVVLLAEPTGEADWQAVWMAGAHQGPRLLTALPPDPGTMTSHRPHETDSPH